MPSWFETSGTLDRIRDFLREKKVPAYLVGGYLRDCLLGRDSPDLDLVVPERAIALAGELANRLDAGFFALDQKRDVGRVIIKEGENEYVVDISRMRGGNIAADLEERDFTIDAMAQDLSSKGAALIDPFEGEKDLREKMVRVVAADSFSRDPLRLLRAVRIAAELGFRIDSPTREEMMAQAHLIADVSRERVRDEIFSILTLENSAAHLRLLHRTGILYPTLHQMPADPLIVGRSMSTVEALERTIVLEGEPWAKLRRDLQDEVAGGRTKASLLKLLALLLHAAVDTDQHPPTSSASLAAVKEALAGLALSQKEIRNGTSILRAFLLAGESLESSEPAPLQIFRLFRGAKGLGREALILALADQASTLSGKMLGQAWPDLQRRAGAIISLTFERPEWISPRPLINGEGLISALRLASSPEIGRILESIQEAQVEGRVETREEALEYAKNMITEKPVKSK